MKKGNTDTGEIVTIYEEYATDSLRVSRWDSLTKKKKISLNVSCEDAIALIKDFLAPVISAMQEEDGYMGHWNIDKSEGVL